MWLIIISLNLIIISSLSHLTPLALNFPHLPPLSSPLALRNTTPIQNLLLSVTQNPNLILHSSFILLIYTSSSTSLSAKQSSTSLHSQHVPKISFLLQQISVASSWNFVSFTRTKEPLIFSKMEKRLPWWERSWDIKIEKEM